MSSQAVSTRQFAAPAPMAAPARLGRAIYDLLTSVRFAVVQIALIGVAGVTGIVLPQLPSTAFLSAASYATQMEIIRGRVEPGLGAGLTDLFERAGLFRVFSAPWFTLQLTVLLVSIVVCTLDRTPRLWRQCKVVRVVQPDPFYEPTLADRAAIAGGLAVEDVRAALRRAHFSVRTAEAGGVRYLYGDRHRWTKMATLITHAGLIGFLLAAAVTSRFGFEAGVLLPTGQAVPIDNVGTPDLVSVKSLSFSAPRDASGTFTDFATDLAVYQGGREIARKVIRVNDPLAVAGYTFHQNFFGPAVDLEVRDGAGNLLWSGPVALDATNAGRPYGRFVIPGFDEGVEMLLDRAADGSSFLVLLGYRQTGVAADGTPVVEPAFAAGVAPGTTYRTPDASLAIRLVDVGAYSGIVVKRDPGAPIVWTSFLLLVTGLVITFYLPRRRVWARLDQEGELRLVARSDRYVDIRREFGGLLTDLVARRHGPGTPAIGPGDPAEPE